MVIINEELNKLCAEQQELIRQIDKAPTDDLNRSLYNISKLIKEKRDKLLSEYANSYNNTKNSVARDIGKKEYKKLYNDLISQYRDVMKLATDISRFKKWLRERH